MRAVYLSVYLPFSHLFNIFSLFFNSSMVNSIWVRFRFQNWIYDWRIDMAIIIRFGSVAHCSLLSIYQFTFGLGFNALIWQVFSCCCLFRKWFFIERIFNVCIFQFDEYFEHSFCIYTNPSRLCKGSQERVKMKKSLFFNASPFQSFLLL